MKKGLRQLAGAALLIIAIGLPSCAAFNQSVTELTPQQKTLSNA